MLTNNRKFLACSVKNRTVFSSLATYYTQHDLLRFEYKWVASINID
jgi:hypothetical protein